MTGATVELVTMGDRGANETWILTVSGATTGQIDYISDDTSHTQMTGEISRTATAAQVQALWLGYFGAQCSGGPLGTAPILIQFTAPAFTPTGMALALSNGTDGSATLTRYRDAQVPANPQQIIRVTPKARGTFTLAGPGGAATVSPSDSAAAVASLVGANCIGDDGSITGTGILTDAAGVLLSVDSTYAPLAGFMLDTGNLVWPRTPFEGVLSAGNSDTVTFFRPVSNENVTHGYNDRTLAPLLLGVELYFTPDIVGNTVLPGGALAGSVGGTIQVTPDVNASIRTGDVFRTDDAEYWRITGPPAYSRVMEAYTWAFEHVAYVGSANATTGGSDDPLMLESEFFMIRSVNGVFNADQSTAFFGVAAHPVAEGATAVNLAGIWNGLLLDDAVLTISLDRKTVVATLPVINGEQQTFTAGDALRLRYRAAN